MTWSEFARAAPQLARRGEERFDRAGVVLVGTIRKDGSPRLSPVEPLILDGDLFLGMMWQSKKALDLLRDPRCLVHSAVCDREGKEGEFKLRGRALDVQDPAVREPYAQTVFEKIGWRPEEPYHLFAVEIESAAFVHIENGQQTIRRWHRGERERIVVRRWTGSGFGPEEEAP